MYEKKKSVLAEGFIIFLTIMLVSTSAMAMLNSDVVLTVETDKSEYYPGEKVIFTGSLTEDGEGVPDSMLCLEIVDPDEVLLFGACFQTNDTGCFQDSLTLDINATLGTYEINLHSVIFDIWANITFEVILENDPPNTPSINGEVNGKIGEEYEYTFVTTDPDEDDVYYWIEWDDGQTEEWIGPYESGEEVIVSHIWDEEGTYVVGSKAKDINEAESDWAHLEVTMPVNQHSLDSFIFRFFERFPRAFPILRSILGM